ncbi:MAG: GEVED domain-containing protein, partial [Bacteroidota bacterium]
MFAGSAFSQSCTGVPSSAGVASASLTSVCPNSTVALTVLGASTDAGIQYQWYEASTTGGPYTAVALANDTVFNTGSLAFTTYYVMAVKCVATGDSVLTNEVGITVLPPLPASITLAASSTSVCAGASVTITATPTNGGTPTYVFYVNGNQVQSGASDSYTYTPANGDVVTAQMTSTATCVTGSPASSNSISITVSSASITGSTVFCVGGSTTLTASANPAATDYAWTLNGSALATTSSITASAAGVYAVVTTDANGCTATASQTVSEAGNPTVSISSDCSTLLAGNSAALSASATANFGTITNYQWVLNGSTNVGTNSSSYNASTGGSYTCVVTNSAGCTGISNAVVIENTSALNGAYTIGGIGCNNFTSFANAFAALNARGVSGNVTFTVANAYTETAPSGGLTLNMCALSSSLLPSATQTITFINGGATKPVISAGVGASTTVDAIIKLVGVDYVTFNGINVAESASNTTATTRAEWGYALLKCDGNNGSNNNSIINCSITLNKANTASRGIYSGNHTDLNTTALTYTGASNDLTQVDASRNGRNTFYGNAIQNVYMAISLNGNATASVNQSLNDTLNAIGVIGQAANVITNFGGGSVACIAVGGANQRGITIDNNSITGGTGTTAALTAINPGAGVWGKIRNNTISLTGSGTTVALRGIECSFSGGSNADPNIVIISGNTVTLTSTTITTGAGTGILCTAGGVGVQNTVTGNTVTGCSLTSTTGGFNGISMSHTSTNSVNNVSNNTITSNTLSGTGQFLGVSCFQTSAAVVNGTATLSNNNVSSNTKTSTGNMFCVYNGLGAGSSVTLTENNNTVNGNVIAGGSAACTLVGVTAQGTTFTMNGNTITNNSVTAVNGTAVGNVLAIQSSGASTISSAITNNTVNGVTLGGVSSGACLVRGILATTAATDVRVISGNDISNVNTSFTTSATCIGIIVATGGDCQIKNNKIHNFTPGQNGSVFSGAKGIIVSGGATTSIYNNLIGFDYTSAVPVLTSNNAIVGVEVTAGSATNIYYNTIRLAGSGSGTGFGSSGINLTSTTPVVDIRNNIVSNTMNGGGATASAASVGLRRVATALTGYSSTSNNNLWFTSAIPAAATALYFDGTTAYASLADFKTQVAGRESNSVTENISPSFISTNGTSANFLHITSGTATFAESGGSSISGINTDYDGDVRSFPSDIGADEFAGTPIAPYITSVTASPSTSGACTPTDRTITAVAIGPVNPITGVVLNYSYNGTAQTPIAMTNGGSGNTWTGVIPGATPGNAVVTYSVTATDGTFSVTTNGPSSYQDAYLTGYSLTATSSSSSICFGSSVNLSAYIGGPATAPSYGPANATSTADEDILGVTFGTLSNTSTCATTGGPGSTLNQYSNYTTSVQAPLIVAGQTYSFSVTVGTCGGVYTNRSVIYIDWNRDGDYLDANEQTAEPAAVSGPHVWTGTITAPTNLSPGKTGMRVITNEVTTVTAPTATFSWGEVEDYYLNLAGGAGFTYSWSDGVNTVFTGTGTFTPSAVGTYSLNAVGTDVNGCILQAAPVIIAVNEIPTAPAATNSTQCGLAIPTASVASTTTNTNPGFNWYANATGGSPLQSSTSATYNTAISTTTTFYVSEINIASGCESARTPVTVTVVSPDPIAITSSANNVCPGVGVTLTINQTGTNNNYVYTWNGNGLSAGTTGNPIVVTPTVGGSNTYSVTATDAALGCVNNASFTITAVAPPSITGSSATPGTICAGSPSTLLGTTTVIGTGPQSEPTGYPASNATSTADEEILNVIFKSINQSSTCATLAPGAGSILNQYSNYTTSVSAPSITTNEVVSFSVQIGTCGGNYTNRSVIYIDWNRDGDFLDLNETAATEPAGVVGAHTWNGTLTVPSNALAGVTRMRVINNETTGITASNVTYTWGETEDYIVNILAPVQEAGTYTWSWSDGSSVISNTNTATVNPTTTSSYIVTATDPLTTCTSSATVTVNVNPLPAAPVATSSSQCGVGVPTCSVSSSESGVSFNWYNSAVGGTLIQGGGSTLTSTSINTSTTFYVSALNTTTNCEGPRTAVLAEVVQPDAVTANVSASTICIGSSIDLSVSQTGSNNTYSYTWNGGAGSGITSALSGGSQTVTPTAIGTYTYTVNAVDGGCLASSTVTVNVSGFPNVSSITASPSTICDGSSSTLSATSLIQSSGPQTAPSGYPGYSNSFPSTDDEQIFSVSFGSMTNNQAETCASNYTDYSGLVPTPTVVSGASVPFEVRQNECDGATYYSNGLSIYIDWNRDGDWADAGEQAYTSNGLSASFGVSPGGDNVRSGNITIPSTAAAGVTKMRVIMAEGVSSPAFNEPFTYGEQEDYLINVIGATPDLSATFTWNPGNLSGSSVSVSPSSTTTYSLAITNSAGCTSTSSVTVNVNPIPSSPTATPSTQCGNGIPTASVTSTSGEASPVYSWYTSATGGAPIQQSASNTLTSTVITTSTTFYVAEVYPSTGCESVRTAVFAEVIAPDAITANASNTTICLGNSINLSVSQTGSTNNYSYSWNGTAGGGITSALSGGNQTVTPTAAGSYVYTVNAVDGSCNTAATVSVTVNELPNIYSAASSASMTCLGTAVTLAAYAGDNTPAPTTYCTTSNFGGSAITNVTINTLNRSSGAQFAFPYYESVSEATATTALVPGNSYTVSLTTDAAAIASVWIDFNRDGVYDASEWVQPFTSATSGSAVITVPATAVSGKTGMRVRTRAAGNINGSGDACTGMGSGETEDYTITILSAAGSFVWTDGTSTVSAVNPATITPTANTTYYAILTGSNGCTASSSGISVSVISTPDVPAISQSVDTVCFSGNVNFTITNAQGGVTYQWQSSSTGAAGSFTDISGANGSTYSVTGLAATTYYQVVASCGSNVTTSAVKMVYRSAPAVVSTVGATRCGPGDVTVSASGSGTFEWYAGSVSTAILGTGSSFTINLTANTTLWVNAREGSCSTAARVPVAITVNTPPVITASSSLSSAVCQGNSATLSVTSSNANYSYTWNGNPGGSAGTGSSITVTPSVSTVYTVTATDLSNGPFAGCNAVQNVTVNINPLPTTPVVTASAAVSCPGTSVTLTATSTASGSQVIPTTYPGYSNSFPSTADEQIFGVTFGSMVNNQSESCGTNYTDYSSSIIAPTVTAGQSVPFEVRQNECDGATYYAAGVSIYIDYNRDGDWNDAGEQAYTSNGTFAASGASPSGDYVYSGNITIPSGATAGLTKMRVVLAEGVSSPSPTESFSYGEQEDYAVNILGPASTFNWSTGGTGSSISVTPAAGSTTYTVTATSAAGCTSAVGTYTITTSNPPSPVLTATDTTLCAPNSINIYVVDNGTYTGGYPAGTTVEWLGYGSTGDPATTPINSSQGSTFQAKVTLPTGCYANSNTVTVTTRDIVVVPTISPAACGNSNGKVIAQIASAPAAPYNYVWTDGTNTIRNVTSSNTTDSI